MQCRLQKLCFLVAIVKKIKQTVLVTVIAFVAYNNLNDLRRLIVFVIRYTNAGARENFVTPGSKIFSLSPSLPSFVNILIIVCDQLLLHLGSLLHLTPTVFALVTFITFVINCYYTCDFYYICGQMLLHLYQLLHL